MFPTLDYSNLEILLLRILDTCGLAGTDRSSFKALMDSPLFGLRSIAVMIEILLPRSFSTGKSSLEGIDHLQCV